MTPAPKPDFSGEWKLNPLESTLSPFAAAFKSGVVQIDHREPVFKYQATLVADSAPVEVAFELRTDRPGLKWDGDALVTTFEFEEPQGKVAITFRYELQNDGRRLCASEQLRGGGRDQDNVWVFDRS